MAKKPASKLDNLPAFGEADELNVVVETPKGSRNKYTFDEKLKLFKLSGVLPVGNYFPLDFGFVPNTLGEDGDPLDVLILMKGKRFEPLGRSGAQRAKNLIDAGMKAAKKKPAKIKPKAGKKSA